MKAVLHVTPLCLWGGTPMRHRFCRHVSGAFVCAISSPDFLSTCPDFLNFYNLRVVLSVALEEEGFFFV